MRPSLLRAVVAFIGMGVAIGVAGPIVKRLPMRESAEAGITWPLLFLGLATAFLFVLRDSYARPEPGAARAGGAGSAGAGGGAPSAHGAEVLTLMSRWRALR